MRTKILTGVVIVLAALLVYWTLRGREDGQRWVKLSSPEGRFEILMPGEPVTGKVIEVQQPTFTAQLHPFTALRPPTFGVMCGYADFPSVPQDPKLVFNRSRDG